jgi:phytoene synthase
MIARADIEHCRAAIRTGSLSFHAASRLLPTRVRDPALVLYAFCRLADDAVDDVTDDVPGARTTAVLLLRDRLDQCYRGTPRNAPEDRAFAALVEDFEMPRALPEALLEGFAWDAMGRRYAGFSDLCSYGARVASAVGAMMCVLMNVRSAEALARACDLGLAMQLTNIARDVGEDARAGRLYLPTNWLDDAGIDPDAFLGCPQALDAVRALTLRLLTRADDLYASAQAGVASLPLSCRPGIFAAGHIYAAIGGRVRAHRGDSVTMRARTGSARKVALVGLSVCQAALSVALPRQATIYARPAPECAFLVDAAVRASAQSGRGEALIAVLAQLEAQDRARRTLDGYRGLA